MSREDKGLAALLRDCETRLIDSRRSVDDALDIVRRATDLLGDKAEWNALRTDMSEQREELVDLVLSALEKRGAPLQGRNDYLSSLIYRDDENHYRLGRRQLALTESERHILDILWRAMPAPVSRQQLHQQLYAGDEKATLGTIDVFVSNLRQKLKLAGGGRDFIQSTRGLGWALNPEFCRNRHRAPGAGDATSARDAAQAQRG